MSPEERLIQAIGAGDPDAFARWVAGAEPRVRDSLASFAARVDTEAVVQETLLRVWQVAPRFVHDGRPEGLTRLAVRIARNLAVSELRRRRADPQEVAALERAAAQGQAPEPPDPLLRELIIACRDKLPGNPSRALAARLAASGGRDDHSLAEELGMKLNTFLQNVRRARLSIARCLRDSGVELPARLLPRGSR